MYICIGCSCRYEDNGDAVNNIAVMVQSTDKNSITGFGDTAKFLEDNKYLLGKQVFVGTPAYPCTRTLYWCSCIEGFSLKRMLCLHYERLVPCQSMTGCLPAPGIIKRRNADRGAWRRSVVVRAEHAPRVGWYGDLRAVFPR